MKPIIVLDDPEGVGKEVVSVAVARNLDAQLIVPKTSVLTRSPAYLFAWMANEPNDTGWMRVLIRHAHQTRPELVLIPDIHQVILHDDRVAQALRLQALMPKTLVLMSAPKAELAIEEMALPFVSRSMCGHSGSNARAVLTYDQARLEISMVFGKDALGIPAKPQQRDYLLWQEFLPGNPFTYRVVRVGTYEMMLRRYRDSHDPFKTVVNEPVTDLDDEDAFSALSTARVFLNQMGAKFCCVDVALGRREKRWWMLGTSARWDLGSEIDESKFFGKGGGYYGRTWIQLLLDELEEGVFG
jgi:hypothetical protein